MGDHRRGARQRAAPQRRVGVVADRVGVEQVERRAARRRRRPRRSRARRAAARGRQLARSPAPAFGSTPASRRPRAFGRSGDLEQAGAVALGQAEPPGDVEQRRQRGGAEPLAPQDHHVAAIVLAEQVGQGADRLRVRVGGGAQRVHVAGRPERGLQRGEERVLAARRIAQPQLRVRVERRRPRRRDREPHAAPAHALADPQVEDRRVVDRLGAEHEHGVRELEVRDGRLQRRRRQRALHVERHVAAHARVDVTRGQPLAQQPLQQEAFLVGRRRRRPKRADRPARLAQRARGRAQRALPRGRPQRVAVAHQRLDDPLLGVDRLVREAALVAQPAVVDALVVARQHAQHALVAHRQLDVALRRAQRADGAGALDVPRPRAEAVRRARSARPPGTAR